MTETARSSAGAVRYWTRTPVIAVGIAFSGLLVAAGLVLSRPDVIAIGLPLALTTGWALLRRPTPAALEVGVRASADESRERPAVQGLIDVAACGDWVQIAVDQGGRRTGLGEVRATAGAASTRTVLRHSGPIELLAVTARAVAFDGAWVSDAAEPAVLDWNAPPEGGQVGMLPVAPRLTGLHGAHEGSRPGEGGDFRDIHPFVAGDELRRVDWRATARAALRPGELLVRRTDSMSDSSVVIAVDSADDLGAVVASWGRGEPDRSGVTSLDHARAAALSIATAAIAKGDRVAYHSLSADGRSLRSGGGARHLARLRDLVAATGQGPEESRYRRSPLVPAGSIIFVLSTFFDGVAAELATRWRAAGHAVVAVDVLPELDDARLTPEQRVATRTLLAERIDVLTDLNHAGIDVVPWTSDDADAAMRVAALRQQRMRAVRR